jgi:hypothetical protein
MTQAFDVLRRDIDDDSCLGEASADERYWRRLWGSENWRADRDYLRFQEPLINLADHLQNHGIFEVT